MNDILKGLAFSVVIVVGLTLGVVGCPKPEARIPGETALFRHACYQIETIKKTIPDIRLTPEAIEFYQRHCI